MKLCIQRVVIKMVQRALPCLRNETEMSKTPREVREKDEYVMFSFHFALLFQG